MEVESLGMSPEIQHSPSNYRFPNGQWRGEQKRQDTMPSGHERGKSKENLGKGQVQDFRIRSCETNQAVQVIHERSTRTSGGLAEPNKSKRQKSTSQF